MRIAHLGLLGALAAGLALPAAAQTTQTTPTKPSPTLTTPTPGLTKPSATQAAPATLAKPGSVAGAGSTGSSTAQSTLVDINSASVGDLDKLRGVGKSRADAIIRNRPYKGKDELLSRHILPPNVYNGIKDKIIAKQG